MAFGRLKFLWNTIVNKVRPPKQTNLKPLGTPLSPEEYESPKMKREIESAYRRFARMVHNQRMKIGGGTLFKRSGTNRCNAVDLTVQPRYRRSN